MPEKKTEVITFRTEEWVKNLLQTAADQNKWSIAQTVNEICKSFVCNPQPDRIVVRTKDLAKLVGECLRENRESAADIRIDLRQDEETKETRLGGKYGLYTKKAIIIRFIILLYLFLISLSKQNIYATKNTAGKASIP